MVLKELLSCILYTRNSVGTSVEHRQKGLEIHDLQKSKAYFEVLRYMHIINICGYSGK